MVLIQLSMAYSKNVFTFDEFADKYSTTPHFNLVNEHDLTRILKSKIFVHTNGQLRATHIILGYDPISSSFQAPKYMIKAKDPRLQQSNIAILGFLTSTSPKGTQLAELPFQGNAEEEVILPVLKEMAKAVEISYFEEEFKIFDQLQTPKPSRVDFSHLPPT